LVVENQLDLGLGSPNDFASLVAMDRFNHEQRQKGGLGYGPPQGLPEALDAVVLWLQEELRAGGDLTGLNVCLGGGPAGGSRLLIVKALQTFFETGDEIALMQDYYNGHQEAIEEVGLRTVVIPGKRPCDFVSAFKNTCASGHAPKGVLICNVTNPTGQCFQQEDIAQIHAMAIEYDFLVLEDYAYGAFDFTQGYAPSGVAIDVELDHTILFCTASKMLGLAGYGLGIMVATTARVQNVLQTKRVLAEGSCKPAQLALASGLNEDRKYIAETREVYMLRGILGNSLAKESGLVCEIEQQGGMFGYYNVNGYRGGASRLVAELKKKKVTVRDDRIYGGNNTQIRVCFRLEEADLRQAFSIIKGVITLG